MKDIAETLHRWQTDGERIAMATVINVDGSAPRDEGAKMLIAASGKIAGSVSGGCVEGAVADEARDVLERGEPKIVRYGINRNMMWDVGLSCGGAIDVFIERLDEPLELPADEAFVMMTLVRGPGRIGAKRRVYAARAGAPQRAAGSTGDAQLDARIDQAASAALKRGSARTEKLGDHDVFVDPILPDAQLIIVGAVHIGMALCDLGSRAGFAVTVVDPRESLNNRERFAAARRLIVGWPEDELPKLSFNENTYVAVLTHDEKFDDPTLDHVLRQKVRYVGAIGSRKTQALRRERLIGAGFASADVDALHAPIGLDIGAQSPEEIAVAILAEMIAAKHDRSGMKLKDRNEQHIHA
ncbi:MAG TPA: XdhC/CoxI family protein [Candidatus Tumulicola sp.]|nr:XdhC/CoxI family protein [Candidatus Tumulicola sp.]